MDPITLVTIAAGAAIALVVAGVAMALVKPESALAEERLEHLTTGKRPRQQRMQAADSLLRVPSIQSGQFAALERLVPSFDSIKELYEQADMSLPFKTFLMIACVMGAAGVVLTGVLVSPLLAPVSGLVLGAGMPYFFLLWRKGKRISLFMASLPEAVELMSRALRAGHGLASGMQLVSQEMKGPVSAEFGRAFEEQNLGVPMDDALRGISTRIPTMDVRFLVTAIIIQRTTGGDLAEVLDKIGRLIRQRFELVGHVKALTAEGRLSGMVLMALPPGLLAFIAASNPSYVSPLFTTTLGTKLLAVTVFLQVLGAVAIKKIISIKV
ncbi:type II secretion system F family protein [Tautonia plasticadhaerens]|uniref:Bacterial type II secretion system protein F domain protein n=1 Tax=Tautonia plasticadhaerens TaxID=2527974 RepID=A0A518H542_9BACT|nr:type II secretion system F family protein [Tautonia plasticadhaerens]QDV35951.1 Bacterial type II secretion system protein F domain protein [Tautonia plasticadhaerens]